MRKVIALALVAGGLMVSACNTVAGNGGALFVVGPATRSASGEFD